MSLSDGCVSLMVVGVSLVVGVFLTVMGVSHSWW